MMYNIPKMEEINSIPYNGYNVISLFSGCGGSSLGYRWAGFKVVYAVEFIKYASDSYSANFPDTIVDTRDIRVIKVSDIMSRTGLEVGTLDVLDGSPPCAPFSTAGVGDAKWGKVKRYSTIMTRVDDLFDEYIRVLNGLKPKVFIAENVTGLMRGRNKGMLLDFLKKFTEAGYKVEVAVVDPAHLGVPQYRERLIFMGVRNDLGLLPSYPKRHGEVITLRDALESLDAPIDPECTDLPDSVHKKYRRLAYNQPDKEHYNLRRSAWNLPVYTVCASGGDKHTKTVMHPDECRKFSIPELKRICSFPDDFILTSSYRHQYERLGRAFPPKAMREIALSVKEILDKAKQHDDISRV